MPSAAHALDSSATAVGVGDASSRRGSNSDGAAAVVKKGGVEKKIEQDGDTFSTPYTTLEAALHGSRLHGEDTLPATSSDEEGEDGEKQERTKRYNMKRTTTTITTASVPSAPPLSPIAATSSPAPSLWSAATATTAGLLADGGGSVGGGLFGLPPATTFDFGAAVDGAPPPTTPIDFAAHAASLIAASLIVTPQPVALQLATPGLFGNTGVGGLGLFGGGSGDWKDGMFEPVCCSICEDEDAIAKVPAIQRNRAEQWSNKRVCDHAFCSDCLVGWIGTCIADGNPHVQCPASDCSCALLPDDVARVAPAHVKQLHVLLNRDFSARASEVAGNPELLAAFRQFAQQCPQCSLWVGRSEGCNAMVCLCGTHFCYRCGDERCTCAAAAYIPAISLWRVPPAPTPGGLFGLPPATTFDFGAAVDGALLFPPTPIDFAAHTGVGAASTVTEASLFGASTTSAQALAKAGTSLVYTSSTSGGLFDTAMPVWPTTTTATSAGLVGTAAGLFAEGGGRVGEGLFGLPPATTFGAMSQSPPPLPPLPPPPPSAYSLWLLDGVAGGVSAHRFHV